MSTTPEAAKPKVFISYSRRDAERFADELTEALQFYAGVEVAVDRHSIVEGDDWKRRLGSLIADADTIVFVISPGSATSEVCQWEVEEACRWSKRILPVLWLTPSVDTQVPERLAALNYIRFDDGRSFMVGVKALIRALHADLDWLREHSRLLSRALEWDRAGRPNIRLLTGNDVSEARRWAGGRPPKATEVTPLHLTYIGVSEQAEQERNDALIKQNEQRAALLAEREQALGAAEEALKLKARVQRYLAIGAGIVAIMLTALVWFGSRSYLDWKTIDLEAKREDIQGQVVSHATLQPASDAVRSKGASLYSLALTRNLSRQDRSILEVVSDAHAEISGGRISPNLSTNMNGHIFLARPHATRRKRAILVAVDSPSIPAPRSPPHDIELMERALREAGFKDSELRVLKNVDQQTIMNEIRDARFPLEGGRAGAAPMLPVPVKNALLVFYFSGANVNFDGVNYIVPVNTTASSEEELNKSALQVERLISDIAGVAAASIILLDTDSQYVYQKTREDGR